LHFWFTKHWQNLTLKWSTAAKAQTVLFIPWGGAAILLHKLFVNQTNLNWISFIFSFHITNGVHLAWMKLWSNAEQVAKIIYVAHSCSSFIFSSTFTSFFSIFMRDKVNVGLGKRALRTRHKKKSTNDKASNKSKGKVKPMQWPTQSLFRLDSQIGPPLEKKQFE